MIYLYMCVISYKIFNTRTKFHLKKVIFFNLLDKFCKTGKWRGISKEILVYSTSTHVTFGYLIDDEDAVAWRQAWKSAHRAKWGERYEMHSCRCARSILYTLASDDFLSENRNIPRKSTYTRPRPRRARCNCRDRKRGLRASLTDIYRDTKMRSCTARSQELSQKCRWNIWRGASLYHDRVSRSGCMQPERASDHVIASCRVLWVFVNLIARITQRYVVSTMSSACKYVSLT